MVQIVHNFAEEINLLAETIPCGVGDTPQKRKYKYSLLNLLSQMEAMAVPLTSIYNLKTYIFSIYVMLGDRDTAVIWCRELARYCSIRQHQTDIIIILRYSHIYCLYSCPLQAVQHAVWRGERGDPGLARHLGLDTRILRRPRAAAGRGAGLVPRHTVILPLFINYFLFILNYLNLDGWVNPIKSKSLTQEKFTGMQNCRI